MTWQQQKTSHENHRARDSATTLKGFELELPKEPPLEGVGKQE